MVATRLHRQAIEVIGRAAVPTVEALAYPTGLDYFLQNWVDGLSMESSYSTDITRSPTTLTEERKALLERPNRLLDVAWLRAEKSEVDRLLVTLRRMTSDKTTVPLYQDTVVISGGTTSSPYLYGDFRYRRYFDGARVAVWPRGGSTLKSAADVDIYVVQRAYSDKLLLDRNLDVSYGASSYEVAPLMDVEVVLDPSPVFLTDGVVQVQLTLQEVLGPNALPPSFTGDAVDGWQTQLGLPVFEIAPNWADGMEVTYRRYGQKTTIGRKTSVEPDGPRYVQEQAFRLDLDNRFDFWRVLNLFDSRRGRTGAFWEVDQEQLWTPSAASTTTIEIEPFGIYSDFEADFTDHLGIVMKNGDVYIREVDTINDVSSAWRLTIVSGNDLPTINVADIERFSRARRKRFESDALSEQWFTTENVRLEFRTTEALNEAEVDI